MPTEKEAPHVTGIGKDGKPNALGELMPKKLQEQQQKEFGIKSANNTIKDVKQQFGATFDALGSKKATPSGLKDNGKPDAFSQLTMSKKTLQEQQARLQFRQAKQTIAQK